MPDRRDTEALYERGVDVDLADIAHIFVEAAAVGERCKGLRVLSARRRAREQRQTFQESSRVFQIVQSALASTRAAGTELHARKGAC